MEQFYLYTGDFSREEMAVLDQWSERMKKTIEEEGGPLDFANDWVPILLCVMHENFRFGEKKRIRLAAKLSSRVYEAIELFHSNTVGRA